LRARGEDTEEVVRRRLHDAAEEIRNYQLYDYVLVNREVEESAKTLSSIVRSDRARRKNVEDEIRPILDSFER
jgi:guanylate kinase